MTRSFLYLAPEVAGFPPTAGGIGACLVMAVAALTTAAKRRPDRLSRVVVVATVSLALLGWVPGLETISPLFRVNSPVSQLHALFLGELLLISSFTLLLALTLYWRLPLPGRRQRLLLILSASCYLSMLRIAAPLWKSLPLVTVVQFPFRLNAVVTLLAGGLMASYLHAVLGNRAVACKQMAVWGGMVLTAAIAAIALLSPHDTTDIARPAVPVATSPETFDGMLGSYAAGDQRRLERALSTSPPEKRSTSSPGACDAWLAQGSGAVKVIREAPGELRVATECPTSGSITVRQVYFPLWKREPADPVYGKTLSASPDGLLQVPISKGKQTFKVVMDGRAAMKGGGHLLHGRDQLAGNAVLAGETGEEKGDQGGRPAYLFSALAWSVGLTALSAPKGGWTPRSIPRSRSLAQ
ncbi:hypothetical protein L4X63_14870 [Geomonas sp. Red32]|uniref:hypothetical protein n=1 Tax=Geomonas sp. Red32 TaxID=2912856 RepID=UPI00202CDD13|nr:hypothetical protein [Geomonas sp. Red32]MCM0082875.1 hypothetical protein [Geomonas sp. Red32]